MLSTARQNMAPSLWTIIFYFNKAEPTVISGDKLVVKSTAPLVGPYITPHAYLKFSGLMMMILQKMAYSSSFFDLSVKIVT